MATHNDNLATHDTAIGAIVSAVLVDTGTTLPDLIAAINDPTANDIVTALLAETVDTVEISKLLEIVLAVVSGVTAVSGSQVEFKKRDGTTTTLTIVFGTSAGERASSVIA